MDGELYDKVRNCYSLYAQIEADTAQFVKAEFEDLAEQAHLVSVCVCMPPASQGLGEGFGGGRECSMN